MFQIHPGHNSGGDGGHARDVHGALPAVLSSRLPSLLRVSLTPSPSHKLKCQLSNLLCGSHQVTI